MSATTAQMLQNSLDGVLKRHVDAHVLRASERDAISAALTADVAALDLESALVPEHKLGAGLGWADVGGVFEILGAHAAPVPLGERIIARWALAKLDAVSTPDAPGVSLTRLTGGHTASGIAHVPWGRDTPGTMQLLATVISEGGERLCLIDTRNAIRAPAQTIGRTPTDVLTLRNAPVLMSVDPGPVGLIEALSVLRAAQIAGALSRVLEMTIDYANTRVQFGRPIGKFQAIQHLIAGLAGEAAAAKAGVQLALRAFDAAPSWQAAAIAKIRASQAVSSSTFAAHETHGAIGVTEEHVLHFFTRRLWQWRADAGDEHVWSERLGRAVLAEAEAGYWPRVVALSGG